MTSDIIRTPPESDNYECVKKNLIKRLSDSREKQLQRLLNELQLEHKKPKQLLREMRELVADVVRDKCLRSLWLNTLPSSVRRILCSDLNILTIRDCR